MNPPTDENNVNVARAKLLAFFISLLLVIFCAYMIVSAVVTAHNTGVLHLDSTNPQAGLTISQNNTQAVFLGTGRANVRLKPGTYQVLAGSNGYQAVAIIHIHKRQSVTSRLILSTSTNVPSSSSLYSIKLQNTAALNSLLLAGQTKAVTQATTNYIINHIDPNTQSATVLNTALNQDGSINYTVKTTGKPTKQFIVVLQKRPDGVIEFLVPASGFSITLNPY